MSMLTIGASDSVCGAGRLCNDCPLEIQSLDPVSAGRHGRHPNLLRRVAWPGSRRIFPFSDETVAVEVRSFARQHARLGGIDFGYDRPFDELIYLPAAEWPVQDGRAPYANANKRGIIHPDRVW